MFSPHGLGSGGASIAVELAKAGVGNFALVDFDRLELHNISRHIAGVNELGRLKTNIVRDAIWERTLMPMSIHIQLTLWKIQDNRKARI